MKRIGFVACLALLVASAPAMAAEFGSAQAECNYLAKDYGVSPENMAEFMADCVARLRPVYEPDAPAPVPVPEEVPPHVEQAQPGEAAPDAGNVQPDAGQVGAPPDAQVAPGGESGDEPQVLEGQAMPEEPEQPQPGEAPPTEEAPDENQQ